MSQVFALREPVSAATHFAGLLWATFGALLLWRLCRGNRPKQLSLACFGLSMMFLYAASATYHALTISPAELRFFQLLDHSAIYGLIAGTYTPIFFVLLRPRPRNILLALMWGLAVVGIICKWTVTNTQYPQSVMVYLAMGWLGLLPMIEITRTVGVRGIALGFLGGLWYTAGALSDMIGWPLLYPGTFSHHELLHVCVLAGTFSHFLFIVRYVVPYPRQCAPRLEPTLVAIPLRREVEQTPEAA